MSLLRQFGKNIVDVTAIYERDGGRCHICRKPLPLAEVVLDHVTPVSATGLGLEGLKSDPNNARIAHRHCNGTRSNSGPGQMPLAFLPKTKMSKPKIQKERKWIELGIEIKALRLRLGLTQQEMAEKLYMSTATVNRWEHGWVKPTKAHVYLLRRLRGDKAPAKEKP